MSRHHIAISAAAALLCVIPATGVAATPQSSRVQPADAAAIKALIPSIYERYRHNSNARWNERRIFSSSTLAIQAENTHFLNGEAGDFDADIFIDAQDNGTITVDAVTLAPRRDGRVEAHIRFSDPELHVRGKAKTIIVERTPAGWRVHDVLLPEQGSFRTVMLNENRRLQGERKATLGDGNGPAAAPTPPTPERLAQQGTFLFTADPDRTCPAYNEGFARLSRVRIYQAQQWATLRAAILAAGCGSDEAYEELAETLYQQGNYRAAATYFQKALTLTEDKATPRILLCRKNGCGINVASYAKEYLKRTSAIMSGQVVRTLPTPQTAGVAPTAATASGVSVWALGRARYLTERGAQCAPETSLGKPFCFGDAIGWLQRHLAKTDNDVIAMDVSYVPGSMVPYNSGQGWQVFKVSRRGDGFSADRQLHFATKVGVPQGCLYNGVLQEAWYITIVGGRKVAVEAKQYACASWGGAELYTRNVDFAGVDGVQLDYTGGPAAYQARAASRGSQSSGDDNARYAGPSWRAAMSGSSNISGDPDTGGKPLRRCVVNELAQAPYIMRGTGAPPICPRPATTRRRDERK